MITRQRIDLSKFEDALANFTGDNFRFSDESLKSLPLQGGRHLFVGALPTIEAIEATVKVARKEDDTLFIYKPSKEPTIMFDKQSHLGVIPSSSIGGRQVWLIQVVLRLGRVPELTTRLLEELTEFLVGEVKGSKVGTFQVKGAELVSRPTNFTILETDHVAVSSTIRFRGVSLLTT